MRQDHASETPSSSNQVPAAPLDEFSRCHHGILGRLQEFAGLPELVEVADRARTVATGTLALFENVVLAHHGDEESELFPAVLRWSEQGEEHDRVAALVQRLTAEHRHIERLWKAQRTAVEAAARGKPSSLQAKATRDLVQAYMAHAVFEEEEFLPLAKRILARDSAHMASLGMSLHMRHAPHIPGYI